MPVYEYECRRCRHRFEMKQGFDDEPRARCPQCRGAARRVIQSTPVIFKGSGFYITDSRKGRGTGEGKGTEAGKGKSETKKSEPETKKSEPGK